MILSVAEPSVDHNMGQIGFNPNARPADGSFSGDSDFGMLYIAQGDGGAYNGSLGPGVDPIRAGQDLSNPFGSILRIDPLGNDADNGAYGIPTDNPFVASGDGKRDEIWAYGLRNPHRFSWDTGGDGAMIISDIGQGNIEELDIGLPGANYGWSEREGSFVFDRIDPSNLMALPVDDALLGYTYPVAQYDHDEGRAIVGGFVYRGSRISDLVGMYVFGDLVNGRIFYVDADALADGSQAEIHELTLVYGDATRTLLDIVGGQRADLRFGIGEDHEIYVLTKRDGMVRALVPEPSGAALLALGLAALAFQRRNSGLACTDVRSGAQYSCASSVATP